MTKICLRCRTNNTDTSLFCKTCGTKLQQETGSNNSPYNSTSEAPNKVIVTDEDGYRGISCNSFRTYYVC